MNNPQKNAHEKLAGDRMNQSIESVLMVEDDAALREALLDTLRSAGIAVLGAADAPAALELIENREIALVISDVQMAMSSCPSSSACGPTCRSC